MKIEKLEFIPVSIAYTHPEVSSQVFRHGVTSVLVKATTDDGLVGWGESCTGADSESIVAALRAMAPYVHGRSPWDSETIRAALWHRGLWSFRKPTACFAYVGIDMALWDLRGLACGEPVYNLLGGPVRDEVDYYYYLSRDTPDELAKQCRQGLKRGYTVFYLKVGIDIQEEIEMIAAVRDTIGPGRKLRLDANAAWTVSEAIRNLSLVERFDIDYIEQPVAPDPQAGMAEVRLRTHVPVCANEGLWTAEDAYRHIGGRSADVYCFSPYWVGSMTEFQRLAWMAAQEGSFVCKHSHGELGIAAAAFHQLLLTTHNIVIGNQHTAHMMCDDVLLDSLPIAASPKWSSSEAPGLGIRVDEDKVQTYSEHYRREGQYLPYVPHCNYVEK